MHLLQEKNKNRNIEFVNLNELELRKTPFFFIVIPPFGVRNKKKTVFFFQRYYYFYL